jgi:hypothetical protein
VGALFPVPEPIPTPPPPRTAPPAPAEPSRRPIAAHSPQSTLVSKRDEAEELRRRITEPGLSEDVEMDLEEIEDFDQPSHAMLVPARTTDTTAPEPLLRPEVASATEVEVPIDIEVAPGTTRISLNIRLLLNLRRR